MPGPGRADFHEMYGSEEDIDDAGVVAAAVEIAETLVETKGILPRQIRG